jgi:hypothetical protein
MRAEDLGHIDIKAKQINNIKKKTSAPISSEHSNASANRKGQTGGKNKNTACDRCGLCSQPSIAIVVINYRRFIFLHV